MNSENKGNYYKEIERKIEALIEKKEYVEALSLVNEELSMPYIPMDTEKRLKAHHNFLMRETTTSNNAINFEKIYEMLNSTRIHEMDKIEIVNLLDEVNLMKYIDEVQQLLIKDTNEISVAIKARLINKLKSQGVESTVKVNIDGNNEDVDLSKISTIDKNKNFAQDSMKVDNLLMKHPVLADTAFMLLEEVYINSILDKNEVKDYGYSVSVFSAKLHQQEDVVEEILKEVDENKLEDITSKIKIMIDKTQIIQSK